MSRKEDIKRWRENNPESYKTMMIKRRQRYRQEAMQLIMDVHGIQGCMFSIHPYMPKDLRNYPCWGHLTFEHPNGHDLPQSQRSGGSVTVRLIKQGKIKPKDLMILCRLHQIWNDRWSGAKE